VTEPVIDLSNARRVGVISDTHGLVRPELYEALEGVDAILHAGDLGSETIEVELSPIAPFHAVAGNVDGFGASDYPRFLLFRIGAWRVGVTHVGLGRGGLVPSVDMWCRRERVDLLVFGHTHQPLLDERVSPVRFNPGACGPRRFDLPVSIGFLDVAAGGEVVPRLVTLEVG